MASLIDTYYRQYIKRDGSKDQPHRVAISSAVYFGPTVVDQVKEKEARSKPAVQVVPSFTTEELVDSINEKLEKAEMPIHFYQSKGKLKLASLAITTVKGQSKRRALGIEIEAENVGLWQTTKFAWDNALLLNAQIQDELFLFEKTGMARNEDGNYVPVDNLDFQPCLLG